MKTVSVHYQHEYGHKHEVRDEILFVRIERHMESPPQLDEHPLYRKERERETPIQAMGHIIDEKHMMTFENALHLDE